MRIEGVTPHYSGFTAPELVLPLAGHCRRDHDKHNRHEGQKAGFCAHLQLASFLSHLAAAGAAGASSNTPLG
jgi:hypothetical protein